MSQLESAQEIIPTYQHQCKNESKYQSSTHTSAEMAAARRGSPKSRALTQAANGTARCTASTYPLKAVAKPIPILAAPIMKSSSDLLVRSSSTFTGCPARQNGSYAQRRPAFPNALIARSAWYACRE